MLQALGEQHVVLLTRDLVDDAKLVDIESAPAHDVLLLRFVFELQDRKIRRHFERGNRKFRIGRAASTAMVYI